MVSHYIYIYTVIIYLRYFKIKIAFFLGIHHFQTLKCYTLCIPKPVVLSKGHHRWLMQVAANQPQMLQDWWVGSNMYLGKFHHDLTVLPHWE